MNRRKELKEEYRQMKFKMGVFKLTNLANGKIFIGGSLDLVAAWHSLKFQLELGTYPNHTLQQDWKSYGSENFTYEIAEEIEQEEESNLDWVKEVKALKELVEELVQPYEEKGYNQRNKRCQKLVTSSAKGI